MICQKIEEFKLFLRKVGPAERLGRPPEKTRRTGQIGRAPATAECLDQCRAGVETTSVQLDRVALGGKRDHLERDDADVVHKSSAVLVHRELDGLARRLHRLFLDARLFPE